MTSDFSQAQKSDEPSNFGTYNFDHSQSSNIPQLSLSHGQNQRSDTGSLINPLSTLSLFGDQSHQSGSDQTTSNTAGSTSLLQSSNNTKSKLEFGPQEIVSKTLPLCQQNKCEQTENNVGILSSQQTAVSNSDSSFGQKPVGQTEVFTKSTEASSGFGFGTTNTSCSSSLFDASTKTAENPFGHTSSTSIFRPNSQSGTTMKFTPPTGEEQTTMSGVPQTVITQHQCITAMKEYEPKSLEELRTEDYNVNRKGNQGTSASPFSAMPASSQPNTTFSAFGQNKSDLGIYGTADVSPEQLQLEASHKAARVEKTGGFAVPSVQKRDLHNMLRHQKMSALILEQKFNGSWELTKELAEILSSKLGRLKKYCPYQVTEETWATCLALTWLQKHCEEFRDEWEMIVTKAQNWITEQDMAERINEELALSAEKYLTSETMTLV